MSLLFFSQESPIRGTGQTQRAKGLQACGHYPEWMGVTGTQERVEQKCIYQSYAISQEKLTELSLLKETVKDTDE